VTPKKLVAVSTSPLPVRGQITDGPGFRMWNLLQEVGRTHDVHILSLYESFHRGQPEPRQRTTPEGFTFEAPSHRPAAVQKRIRELAPDVLYLPWQCVAFLGRANERVPTLIDYVGPGLLEEFVGHGRIPATLVDLCLSSFGYGDLYLTTTERERFYVLGLLAASHRLSVPVFDRFDPLVKVVRMTPSGTEDVRPPNRSGPGLVVLLAGAFLPWYDYSVLADAVNGLHPATAAQVKVRVLGGNPRDPSQVERVHSSLLGGRNAACFEFIGLVPFDRRLEFYRSADVALAVGPESVEDDLSARTRVVDALGAGVPILAPGRDEYSRDVIAGGAGFGYTSAESLEKWLSRLVAEPAVLESARSQIRNVRREQFDPSVAARPVLEFIAKPRLVPRARDSRAALRGVGLAMRDLSASVRKGRP
jgi:glycosyltransferase involved in cell wall biosynthesis